jgi:hypothetical protein
MVEQSGDPKFGYKLTFRLDPSVRAELFGD